MFSGKSQREWLAVATGLLSLPLFAAFFFSLRSIPDLDSYYHLAVARLYASHGFVRGLPWARASILGSALGDKELLFHVLLIPFSGSAAGGRVALAMLNAAIVALIGTIGYRAAGLPGALAGIWVDLTAGAFFFRTVRLRPELMALLLILALVWFLARRQAAAAGVACALFTLSYTAWHVPLGLAILIAIVTRERDWRLVGYPAIGTTLGIVARPHVLDSIRIFWIQNVLYFLEKSRLDVGNEIVAPRLDDLLLYDAGFWIGIGILIWIGLRRSGERQDDARRRELLAFTTAAAVFLILFLFLERMATYAFPFILLAALFYAGRIPRGAMVILAACVLASAPWMIDLVNRTKAVTVSEDELRGFGAAVPGGARVAATWGAAEAFAYWAPQGKYLNVLDPIFMAENDPRAFAAQRAVFAGEEPDVPGTVKSALQSDFLALRKQETPERLIDRLRNDPRARLLHGGENLLVTFVPSKAVVASWSVRDPALPARIGRYVGDGYVDLTAGSAPCYDASAIVDGGSYELASTGPASLQVDRQAPIRVVPVEAVLGRGSRFSLSPGRHEVTIRSCRGGAHSIRNGFYFVRR